MKYLPSVLALPVAWELAESHCRNFSSVSSIELYIIQASVFIV